MEKKNRLVVEDNKPSKVTRSRLLQEQPVSHENIVVGSIAKSTRSQWIESIWQVSFDVVSIKQMIKEAVVSDKKRWENVWVHGSLLGHWYKEAKSKDSQWHQVEGEQSLEESHLLSNSVCWISKTLSIELKRILKIKTKREIHTWNETSWVLWQISRVWTVSTKAFISWSLGQSKEAILNLNLKEVYWS